MEQTIDLTADDADETAPSSKRQAIDLTADDSDEAAPDLAQLHREREARQPWRLRRPSAS